jgi:hypothetical protein
MRANRKSRRKPSASILRQKQRGLRLLSWSRLCEEIRRNPQNSAVCSYLDRLRLGVKRGMMNSCAIAANKRSAVLMPKVTNTFPMPRFESG